MQFLHFGPPPHPPANLSFTSLPEELILVFSCVSSLSSMLHSELINLNVNNQASSQFEPVTFMT